MTQNSSQNFSHTDNQGNASMVDISDKDITQRMARAEIFVHVKAETENQIKQNELAKGDVLATARIAGIQAAKKCSDLIPLCHPLMINKAGVSFEWLSGNRLRIESICKVSGKTGIEMEALTAASVAALTVYDMCKAIDKSMVINGLKLLEKEGGRSGHFLQQSNTE